MLVRFLSLSLFALSLLAQVTGRLSGSVVDATGPSIELFLPGGQTSVLTAQTSADGFFCIAGVRPEVYDLHISS